MNKEDLIKQIPLKVLIEEIREREGVNVYEHNKGDEYYFRTDPMVIIIDEEYKPELEDVDE